MVIAGMCSFTIRLYNKAFEQREPRTKNQCDLTTECAKSTTSFSLPDFEIITQQGTSEPAQKETNVRIP